MPHLFWNKGCICTLYPTAPHDSAMGSAYIPFDPWLLNLFKYLWLDDSGTGIDSDSDPEDNSDIDMDDIDSDASSVEGIYDFRY